jgi:hypothetical protein
MRDDETRRKDRDRMRKWRSAHPEEARASARRSNAKWFSAHPEESRERVRRWQAANPGKTWECNKLGVAKWRSLNGDKVRAHWMLARAIKRGEVSRPDTCQCGAPNPEGHHPDYSKPLMVMWLCYRCHKKLHMEERAKEKNLNIFSKSA